MKITLENKAKFFAQYYGQDVLKASSVQGIHKVGRSFMGKIYHDQYLELKPISSITDGLKSELEIEGCCSVDYYGVQYIMGEDYWTPLQVDVLRSRGYAFPYLGLSVKQLIEYGWIKLKED